jgi:hypothetical protein
LIDHHVATISWTHSHIVDEANHNAMNLAKIATALGILSVLTSSMEDKI